MLTVGLYDCIAIPCYEIPRTRMVHTRTFAILLARQKRRQSLAASTNEYEETAMILTSQMK